MSNRPTQLFKLTDLEKKLEDKENELFENTDVHKIRNSRHALMDVIGGVMCQRLRLGEVVSSYHSHFEDRRLWSEVAGDIALACGYRSPKSLYTLMDDAKRALDLDKSLFEELLSRGIDPAKTRHAALVDSLLNGPKPNSEDLAAKLVEEAIRAQDSRVQVSKKTRKQPSRKQLFGQLTRSVQKFLDWLPEDRKDAEIEVILRDLAGELKILGSKTSHDNKPVIAGATEIPEGPFEKSPGSRNTPETAQGPEHQDGNVISSIKTNSGSGLIHPFGDTHLSSIVCSENGRLRFENNKLHAIYDEENPKRFFVGGDYDLFDSRVHMDLILEHLEVFTAAPQHIFQIVTSNLYRFSEVQSIYMSKHRKWPSNIWMGLMVQSNYGIRLIEDFGAYRFELKWVFFLPGETWGELLPGLDQLLAKAGIRWVVFGRPSRQSLARDSKAFAQFVSTCCHRRRIPFFWTTEEVRDAFIAGKGITPDMLNYTDEVVEVAEKVRASRQLPAYRPFRYSVSS